MAKEFFKDLPNTTTPLTANRLNGLLDGEEAMGNIVVDSIKSKNMINVSQSIYGFYYDANGNYTSVGSTYLSDYIEVEPGNTYTFSGTASVSNTKRVNYFNSSKTWVSQVNSGSTNEPYSFTIPSNIKYIRISWNENININTIQLEKGNTATDYAPYQKLDYDYEEGTWTPELNTRESAKPTVTYTTQKGSYKKIGNIVFIDFYIRAKITVLNGTNNFAAVTGLPFTPKSTTMGEEAINLGVLYNAVETTTDVKFCIQNGRIVIVANYGTYSSKWIVTSGNYMEIGGSGFYFTK